MNPRIARLEKQIRMRVAMLLIRDISDPRIKDATVTITKTKLDRELDLCKVYWSTLAEGGARTAVQHALDEAAGWMHREVGNILRTKKSPRIQFVFDQSIEGAERISNLLRSARAVDDERARQRGDAPLPSDATPPLPEPDAQEDAEPDEPS